MDDLTAIRGIGPATAARLAQAGAGSFAALAAADPAALAAHPALRGIRAAPGDIAAWIAEAARRAAGDAAAEPVEAGDAGATGPAEPGAPAPPRGGTALVVTGPARGRWRAGRFFGPEPQQLALAALTGAEVEAIRADPALRVALVPSAAD